MSGLVALAALWNYSKKAHLMRKFSAFAPNASRKRLLLSLTASKSGWRELESLLALQLLAVRS
jgi:hypothetical protein